MGLSEGARVGEVLGISLGVFVGPEEGARVGGCVGDSLGVLVGLVVGADVGVCGKYQGVGVRGGKGLLSGT